jgi:hypothetical protein
MTTQRVPLLLNMLPWQRALWGFFCLSYCRCYQMMSTFNGGSGSSTKSPSNAMNHILSMHTVLRRRNFFSVFFSLCKIKTSTQILLNDISGPVYNDNSVAGTKTFEITVFLFLSASRYLREPAAPFQQTHATHRTQLVQCSSRILKLVRVGSGERRRQR